MKKEKFLLLAFLVMALSSLMVAQDGYHNNPKPILTTNFINTQIDINDSRWTDPTWTNKVCSNNTWLKNDPPKYEWTPIINPNDEFSSIVGLTGYALDVHESKADMPFTHPFGFDFNYLIVPDTKYENLLGPSNADLDSERIEANLEAKNSNISAPKGYLAVEEDRGLIPNEYRVSNFSRVALFGRWIVDCGHDNFLTEIHPPLLTVFAQAAGNVDVIGTLENSITTSKIISLPYLVSQNFENGDLRNQIAKQVSLVKVGLAPLIPLTDQMKAKPTILKPFSGLYIFQYTIHPPVIPNELLGVPSKYKLYVEYQLTVRAGIVIQIAPDGFDGVLVTIEMNDVNYQKDDNTLRLNRKDYYITPDVLGKLDDEYGVAFKAVVGETAFADPDPVKAEVLNKGFLSDLYDPLVIPSNSISHKGFISSMTGNTKVNIDNSQPFPVYGWINVGWKVGIEEPHLFSPLSSNISNINFIPSNINKSQLITITNSSDKTIQIGELSLAGANANGFKIQNKLIKVGTIQDKEDCSGTTLEPNKACSFRVSCNDISSTDPKVLTAELHIPSTGHVDLIIPITAQQLKAMGAHRH